MTLRPVGLTRDLPDARVMRALVDGQDVVVWRSASGVLNAWDNRCPHRGMALSHGFVRGEDLACLYHGWHFGCDGGQCSLIPSHPDLTPPETIRTRIFSAQEVDGVIWVSLEPAAADMVDQPETEPDTKTGFAPLRSLEILASEPDITHAAKADPFADATLRLLFNPLEIERTLVTVLIEPQASETIKKQASRWCEVLRREVEA